MEIEMDNWAHIVVDMKDCTFVPSMFVILSFGPQMPLIKGHIPWFRDPSPRVQILKVQRKTP